MNPNNEPIPSPSDKLLQWLYIYDDCIQDPDNSNNINNKENISKVIAQDYRYIHHKKDLTTEQCLTALYSEFQNEIEQYRKKNHQSTRLKNITRKIVESMLKNQNTTALDLSYCKCDGQDLSGLNLTGSNFSESLFVHCIINNVNMSNGNFVGSNFQFNSLINSHFENSYIKRAHFLWNFSFGNAFPNSTILESKFTDSNLGNADFRKTILQSVSFAGSTLAGAKFSDSIMNNIYIDSNTSFFALQCPETGSFVAYKKYNNKILKILVPEDAKRSSSTSRLCRCSKYQILHIENDAESVDSCENPNIKFYVGDTVSSSDFDDNRWNENGAGCTFYLTEQEAKLS